MALAASFLGGAKSRLLPASIPFRFFGAAVVAQLLAWLALLAGAAQAPGFAGGLGLPLAALHLVTLGMLVMTALGASLQLLPVATRQPVGSPRLAAALWWLYLPGVLLTVGGMATAHAPLLAAGAVLAVLALLLYALLLADNRRHAKGMPVVVAHGWAAWCSLLLALASGLSLAAAYHGHGFIDRGSALLLHVSFAAYGFMGLLVMGFSYILVPMFALAENPPQRPALASAAAAGGGLVLLLAAAAGGGAAPPLAAAAAGVGLLALALHVHLMLRAMAGGLRKQLGRSFVLVRLGWGLLLASLPAAGLLVAGAPVPRLGTLFGVLLVGGLLTFLLGILSRIVPFLASMHAAGTRRGPPMPSTLTDEGALAVHFGCHLAALALLLAAVVADSPGLARAAGAAGSVGALAFGRFFLFAWRRLQAPAAPAAPRQT